MTSISCSCDSVFAFVSASGSISAPVCFCVGVDFCVPSLNSSSWMRISQRFSEPVFVSVSAVGFFSVRHCPPLCLTSFLFPGAYLCACPSARLRRLFCRICPIALACSVDVFVSVIAFASVPVLGNVSLWACPVPVSVSVLGSVFVLLSVSDLFASVCIVQFVAELIRDSNSAHNNHNGIHFALRLLFSELLRLLLLLLLLLLLRSRRNFNDLKIDFLTSSFVSNCPYLSP